ncbi:hypothetical protein HN935_02655 [archaeon]|jgi:hypothetical protein|nr:hypothetical protein [archaeon]
MPRRNIAPLDSMGNPLRVGRRYVDGATQVAPFNLRITAIREGYISWQYDAVGDNLGDCDNSDNWCETVEELAAEFTPLTRKDIHDEVAELTRKIKWYAAGFDLAPASSSRRVG